MMIISPDQLQSAVDVLKKHFEPEYDFDGNLMEGSEDSFYVEAVKAVLAAIQTSDPTAELRAFKRRDPLYKACIRRVELALGEGESHIDFTEAELPDHVWDLLKEDGYRLYHNKYLTFANRLWGWAEDPGDF